MNDSDPPNPSRTGNGDSSVEESLVGEASNKRQRILLAAISVFAEKGFYSARVSEIAKAAGVADGTIYLYFKNKEDVLISIFDDRLGRLISVLREEASAARPTEAKLRRIVELQLGLLEEQRDLAEVITVNLRQSSKLLKQYAAPLFEEYLDTIAGVIAEGQHTGAFRSDVSPRIASRALWGALDGVALTWALGATPDPVILRKAAQQTSTLFLRGLRAQVDSIDVKQGVDDLDSRKGSQYSVDLSGDSPIGRQ